MNSRYLFVAAAVLMLVLALGAGNASAQQCPNTDTTGTAASAWPRTLEGKLIYHDDIRQWFELRLAKPECSETSIQLIRPEDKSKSLERYRGCQVRSVGPIDFSPTGYYSANLYQDVTSLRPIGSCHQQRPLPEYSNLQTNPSVRAYAVDMHVNYGPGDHPVVFTVRSAGKALKPPQAYASYWLTGGYVLYGLCAKGFVIDRVYGPSAANPSHFDDPRTEGDMAAFDPETAASKGITDLHLGYTCIRARSD